jgi:hypothetical protein
MSLAGAGRAAAKRAGANKRRVASFILSALGEILGKDGEGDF